MNTTHRAEMPTLGELVAADDRNAVLYWLRHSTAGREARLELASKIMYGTYACQAGLEDLVVCGRCADRGCDYCSSGLQRRVG